MIYFIRAGNAIKIGIAADVGSRLRNIQTANHEPCELLVAIPGSPSTEQMLHQMFAEDRIRGEWFKPSEKLLSLIEEIKTAEDPGDAVFDRAAIIWNL